MPKLSLLLPFHQTEQTAFFLSRLLKSIEKQSFKDYEIILTSDGAMAENHNAAIRKAKGEIIQFMGMDDYFTHPYSLDTLVEEYDKNPDKAWAVTACMHHNNGREGDFHMPEWTDDIYTGNNKIGGLSVLSMRRDKAIFFEEPLQWLIDVDMYYRLYLKYGLPIFISNPNISVDTRETRSTHTISNDLKANEVEYLQKKYGHR